jgi:integrase/recombinase XerD
MKPLKTKAESRPVEPEQESYGVCCIESVWQALVDEFAAYLSGIGRTARTLEHHHASLKLWRRFLDEKGVAEVAAVTPQTVADYQAWLYEARSRYKRPYTLQSQIGILNSLQVFHKFLVKTHRLLADPTEALQLPKEPKRLPGKILSTVEMKRLLAQPDTATVLGFRDRTLYEVFYSTGLRVTEAIRLRVQDFDQAQATLFIAESKHFKDRYVPVGQTACRFLTEYLARIRPLLLRNFATFAPSRETLFLSRLGRALDKSGVEHKLHLYAARAKIKKHLTVHVFRHTVATEMLRHGADLRQIQELLGHKNLRTTQIYTHIVKGELRRVQSQCHPREQTELPDGFVTYRGRDYLTDEDRKRK